MKLKFESVKLIFLFCLKSLLNKKIIKKLKNVFFFNPLYIRSTLIQRQLSIKIRLRSEEPIKGHPASWPERKAYLSEYFYHFHPKECYRKINDLFHLEKSGIGDMVYNSSSNCWHSSSNFCWHWRCNSSSYVLLSNFNS